MIVTQVTLSDVQAMQLIELINRAPCKGEEAEAVVELKTLIRSAFQPKEEEDAARPRSEVQSEEDSEGKS